ncbi:MAG: hypothetical protein M3R25_00530, partial [Bacteroidota bacterium]|nr:hypothetical protein [Bacteroidota bacterium]
MNCLFCFSHRLMGKINTIGITAILGLLILINCIPVSAQEGKLMFHQIGTKSGLSELTNPYVYQDLKGFVWIASISGLNRYDGKKVKTYVSNSVEPGSLWGENIQSNFFEEDSAGFWFSTYTAINYYDRALDKFNPYFKTESGDTINGYHAFYLDSEARLWVLVGEKTIYTFDIHSETFTLVKQLSRTLQRAKAISDAEGNVTQILGFSFDQPGLVSIKFEVNGNPLEEEIILSNYHGKEILPREILVESEKSIWIGGYSEIIQFNLISGKIRYVEAPGLLDIEFWTDTTLIVSIIEKGLVEFNNKSFSFGIRYSKVAGDPFSLISNEVRYISKVNNGGFWFSHDGKGLSFIYRSKQKFQLINPNMSEQGKLFSPVSFKEIAENSIYVALDQAGMVELNSHAEITRQIPTYDQVATTRLKSAHKIESDHNNNLWIFTYKGICHYSQDHKSIISIGNPMIIDGLSLTNGDLLCAHRDSCIYRITEGNTKQILDKFHSEIFPKAYYSLFKESNGRLWFSSGGVTYDVYNAAGNQHL